MATAADLINDLRVKYSRALAPTEGVDPATSAPTPGAVPQNGASVSRFTGLGMDNQLQEGEQAGVVHEGEQVIEAEAVTAAGGPKKIRAEVDRLIKKNGGVSGTKSRAQFGPDAGGDTFNPPQKGFRGGTGKGTVRGYQAGTGAGTVQAEDELAQNQIPDAFAGAAISRTTDQGAITPPVQEIQQKSTDVNAFLPILDVNRERTTQGLDPIQTGAPTTAIPGAAPGVTPDTALETGVAGLGRIAAGESQAADLAERQARQRLEGSQASRFGAQAQQLAQEGVTGGLAVAERARLQRQEGIETTGLESELAQKRAERGEAAVSRLADVGVQSEGVRQQDEVLDELIRATKAGETLSKDQLALQSSELDEIIRANQAGETLTSRQVDIQQQSQDTIDKKIGSEVALNEQELSIRADKFDMEKNTAIVSALMANGQFDLAEQVMNDMGMRILPSVTDSSGNQVPIHFDLSEAEANFFKDIQFGHLGDAANLINTTEAGANISADMSSADSWTELNKNPELRESLAGAWKAMVRTGEGIPEGMEWGSDASKEWAQNNIVSTKLQNDEFFQASQNVSSDTLLTSFGLENFEGFEYLGRTGEDAARLATTDMFANGAIAIDSSGNMVPDLEHPFWKNKIAGGTDGDITPINIVNNLTTLSDTDFNTAIKNPDNIKALIDDGAITQVNNATDIQNLSKSGLTSILTGEARGVIALGDNVLKIIPSDVDSKIPVVSVSSSETGMFAGVFIGKDSEIAFMESDLKQNDGSPLRVFLIISGPNAGKTIINNELLTTDQATAKLKELKGSK